MCVLFLLPVSMPEGISMLLRSLPMRIRKRLVHDVINTFVTRADLVRDVPYTEDNRHKMATLTAVFSRL